MEITAEKLIEQYHKEKPKLVWHIGRDVFDSVRRLRDGNAAYLMTGAEHVSGGPVTLLGHPFKIVEGSEIRLITVGGHRE